MAYETLKDSIKKAIKQNGNQEITGDVMQTTLLSIIDSIPEQSTNKRIFDLIADTGLLQNYTYWPPTSEPYYDTANNTVTWDELAIYNYNTRTVILSKKNMTAKGPTSGLWFVYYNLSTQQLVTLEINSTLDEEDSLSNMILLGFVEGTTFFDLMFTVSRYIPGAFDLSQEGKAKRLYPEAIHSSKYEPLLYIKYPISGLTGTSKHDYNVIDVRIVSDVLHRKYDFVHIEGKAYYTNPKNPVKNLKFYIASSTNENKLQAAVPVDSTGAFNLDIDLPITLYDSVDVIKGYTAFLFIYNTSGAYVNIEIDEAYAGTYPGKNSYPVMSGLTINELTHESLNVTAKNTIHGNAGLFTNSRFPVAAENIGVFATTLGSQADEDGFLTKIHTTVGSAGGSYKFYVGLLDQYDRFVPSKEFSVYIPGTGYGIDVSDLNIPIKKGEQLAISVLSLEGLSSASSLCYIRNTSGNGYPANLFYGTLSEVWHDIPGAEHGGYINLAYEIKTVKSIFALDDDVNGIKETVSSLQQEITKSKFIYDSAGNAYTLSVIDGSVVVKSTYYSNVLALGNSLTSHSYAPNIGYYGDDAWAMASTNKETTTWTMQLQNILREKNSLAKVTPFNIASWETNRLNVDLQNLFKDHIGKNYDLIIIRAGENGDNTEYSAGVERLITFIMEQFKSSKIVITSMLWPNTVKDSAFKNIAAKYNLQYIYLGNISDKCLLGQMLMGSDNNFHPIIHNGVALHCTDTCYLNLASAIGLGLGYNKNVTSKLHTVNISSSGEYSINQLTQVENGYVTILTYGSVPPTVSSNIGSVSFTNIDLKDTNWINTPSKIPTYATVFKMPDSDISISMR